MISLLSCGPVDTFKTLISLMLTVFVGTVGALTLIYRGAQREQNIRLWETNRLRAYECIYEHQYNSAAKFFKKASDASRKIGKNDYHFAVSLEDAAFLDSRAK